MSARMQQRHLRLVDAELGSALHAPAVRTQPVEMQLLRKQLLQAIVDAKKVEHLKLRSLLLHSLYRVASELGCAVCGAPIDVRELECCELTQRSLVHLHGSCSDQLAKMLGLTPDEVLRGDGW
jgi:hypothetical protein